MKMIIIQDTKEKEPWNFLFYDECKGQERKHLQTGDYTVQGYEQYIIIERKRSVGEISTNLGKKLPLFRAEFERMLTFPYRFLICEFPPEYILSFPKNSGIPPSKWGRLRLSGKYIMKTLYGLCEEFGVEIFFCETKERAEEVALALMLDSVERIINEKKSSINTI